MTNSKTKKALTDLALLVAMFVAIAGQGLLALSQASDPAQQSKSPTPIPPRVAQAQRFLAQRGWGANRGRIGNASVRASALISHPIAEANSNATAAWQPLGPVSVLTANYGPVTGRISSIAIDPADTTGNKVFVGTTGGGVWVSQNAATSSADQVQFTPLTDRLSALAGARDASVSIGALTVQPGGTGVILAGTGDPNDALDSYYGAGILRSADGGNSWSLIPTTSDQILAFTGEGFAGFAWSTANPQLVVAAVSQAYGGTVVNAERPYTSYAGLYYSLDSGLSWSLARITDGATGDVQGPLDAFAYPHGNAATAVVWNPIRRLFIAAIRYHGYYQSTDGVIWARMSVQPGMGLTPHSCPTNLGATGSLACPIFRGALTVNLVSGDTFAWTVDAKNQDQGIWQDECAISAGSCSNQAVAFQRRWDALPLEANTALGPATISNGDYNLTLDAVPTTLDTILLAGANDLWKCSLANGCAWRNTTNANSCMSAHVAGYQHALAWSPTNPQEIFIGNDSGLWRSMDGIGETGQACDASDASHFQNLNTGLGSLAEVVSFSQGSTSPYTMMAGLGVNGTAGVKSTSGPTAQWPQVLDGYGGPVAIDPANASNWYVNNWAGVSIHLCAQEGDCTAADFGAAAVVGNNDVSGDGNTMPTPAPFLVDPLDFAQLLVGTCRVWRGPADGSGWSGANAISAFFGGVAGNNDCNGHAIIRAIAAQPLTGGGEVIYVGMYGAEFSPTKAGHVFKATFNPASGSTPLWQDLTLNPVSNDSLRMNYYALDISSIAIDPHDATGNTVYVTVEGIPNSLDAVRMVYRSTDGGAHWASIVSNLTGSPANSIVVDPQDSNTVYIATDIGVFSTRQISTCATAASSCWSAYGAGLPNAPVVQLSAAPAAGSLSVLAAATYGRGVWQIPLWTAGMQLTTAIVSPDSLTFGEQTYGTTSSAQTVTLTNTGGIALELTAFAINGDFREIDDCTSRTLNAGASCAIHVTFTPTQTGSRIGTLKISGNVAGGQLSVDLDGTGTSAGTVISLAPSAIDFGQIEVGKTSTALQITAENSGSVAMPVASVNVTAPFVLASNGCGTSLAANSDCQLTVEFAPKQSGPASGALTLSDSAGSQTVALTGRGAVSPTDDLAPTSLTFPSTVAGQQSPAQSIVLTNGGDISLSSIAISVSAGFQTTNNCGTLLAEHSSCSISVEFSPSQPGSQTGTLSVVDAIKTQSVALSGTGLQAPAIGVNPTQLNFAAQPVGAASPPLTLTVSNTGGAPMANLGFQISGSAASSYALAMNTCAADLNRGGSCTVQVVFRPMAPGANAAVITVTSSTLGVEPVQIQMTGIGQAASGLTISPAELAFTEPVIGSPSPPQLATITNTSKAPADGLALSTAGPFSLTQNTCGTSLAVGASCATGIVFTATADGVAIGTLTVSSSSVANPAVSALTGIGGAAGTVLIQPSLLKFSATGVGTVSSTQLVTVTNSSAVVLPDFGVSASSGFQVTDTTCVSHLATGASCTATLTFAPANAGQQTGSLTIRSSMLPSAVRVPLSGMGVDFSAAVSGGSSQVVASGQTARFTVVLSPLNGSSGTFAFQCGSLPANSACSFNPTSETVAANTTGSVMVQIATGQVTISAQPNAPPSRVTGLRILPMLCGLMLVPLALNRRRRTLLFAGLLTLLVVGVTSCAGAGGGTGTAPPAAATSHATPAGTYSVPVSVTSSGVTHKVTVSLTVD